MCARLNSFSRPALASGTAYGIFTVVAGRTAGTLTPELTGGTTQTGAVIDADGTAPQEIAAGTGNTGFAVSASSDFDGSVEAFGRYARTASCAPQGRFAYVFIPLNADDVAGPQTAGFETRLLYGFYEHAHRSFKHNSPVCFVFILCDGSFVRQSFGDLASQLASRGAIADALAATSGV